MPNPTSSDLHPVDEVRSELSIAYMNDREFLAGDAIAPILPVTKESGRYAKWSQADFMRIQMELVADGAETPIMSMGVATETYFCNVYGGRKLITPRERSNAKNDFLLDQAVAAFVTHQALLKRELLIANNLFATGVWATDSTPGTKWSSTSSAPFADLRTGARAIQSQIGKWPTDLILGANVWDNLADHADTIARISGGSTKSEPAQVLPEQIAQILGLKRVTIGGAVYNTASAGAAVSMSTLYNTNDALLVYRPDSAGQFEPSGAYTFSWAEFDNVNPEGAAIRTWQTDSPRGEWFEGEMALDPKVTATEAGYFFSAATA